jgi:accessory colonization factor AcfC
MQNLKGVLNTFTENNFQDAFIMWVHWDEFICSEGDYFVGEVD